MRNTLSSKQAQQFIPRWAVDAGNLRDPALVRATTLGLDPDPGSDRANESVVKIITLLP